MTTAGEVLPETALPLDLLLRLHEEGVRGFSRLEALAVRGDWRTRALALSAIGRLVREDPTAFRPSPLRRAARRVPGLRRRLPTVGAHGAYVRGPLLNALSDRSWIVRTAAALAAGECRDPSLSARLTPALADHSRPVRLAAAAALLRAGAPVPVSAEALLAAEPAPLRIGDTGDAREWLERLVRAHAEVVRALVRQRDLATPAAPGDAAGWTALLAGEPGEEKAPDPSAEVRRYAQQKENQYNFTKPFTPGTRDQNTRLLHSFLVVAEQMEAPQGGRVLDLGGGAAWVSDLLAKLGYKPVTLDIAPALLRVGKDRFTREHLPFRAAAADMTALPFAEGSFEAVLIIDALHHVGNVPAVFREAFRVLVPGGQFLLAEPGEGHAESEKSRGEMSDHGVCEREIHLFEAVRYGKDAGFDRVRVVPHYVPGIFLTPDDLRAAIAHPSERWPVRLAGGTGRFDEYLLQSVFSHPILAFGKGERVLDSRAPRKLRAVITPALRREGTAVTGTVRIANAGDTRWLRGGDETGRVRLGFQLMSPERRLLDLDFARRELPRDLAPGEEAEIALSLAVPDAQAPYVLKIDMVDEHICWFEDMGSLPVYLRIPA